MSRFFGNVCQNGYVVRDIEAALKHWTEVMGVGPFYYIDRVKCDWFTYKGEPSPVEMSIALGNTGDLQIELIQQRNDAPSMYMDFLNAGREGLQHMSWWTTDYQAQYDRAIAAGFKVGHEGQIGGPQGRFVYFDTETHPGTVIEMSDISGAKGKFFEHIRKAAIGWDGTDPVRPVK
ncbi:MAG: VOC family protein [Parvibaculum sp.]|uniref:VOC family protein n=1 Tax=Parvibaculum sp. TaxID=2024848 RepID=UPI000CC2BE33|nr:VOC family protein [Parvibaculum sp.]MDZ4382602.1 VOC family protein [Parvibaculum sp.]PKP79200.1 MAG: glyoxalase [Alphaproteobacteria bacterium HGW-Alphaproteobacteria-3]